MRARTDRSCSVACAATAMACTATASTRRLSLIAGHATASLVPSAARKSGADIATVENKVRHNCSISAFSARSRHLPAIDRSTG